MTEWFLLAGQPLRCCLVMRRSCSSWRRTLTATASSELRSWSIWTARPVRVSESRACWRCSSMSARSSGTTVESGAADAGERGNGVGGDGFAVGGELGASPFDAADVVGRSRRVGRLVAHPVWAVPSAPSSTSRRAISAW